MAEPAVPRWAGAAPQIVFEDAHLRVMFKPGGSDMLLVTFGGAGDLASGTAFFADRLVATYGINCLGFMPHAAHWYPRASMQAAASALGYTLSAFAIRIGYGTSMGAYGAIKHSALLGLTHVMAYCPQWSIDPAECGAQESGFWDFWRPEMAGMAVRAADMQGQITIFYDPLHAADPFHFAMLRAAAAHAPGCRVQECLMPHAGHHLAPVLAGGARTTALIAACYHNDRAALTRITAPARRASRERRRNLLNAATLRHPVLTLRALRQLAREGQMQVPDGARCLIPLHRALRGCAPALAEELVGLLLPAIAPLRRRLLLAPWEASPDATLRTTHDTTLRTTHDTTLCYSALGGCLVHLPWPPGPDCPPGLRPVFLHEARLAVRLSGAVCFCRCTDDRGTELADTPDAACLQARPAGDGAVCLEAADRYASAEPDGTVWRGATEVRAWERFEPKQAVLF